MNEGRTVFAQLMDQLPKYEFEKCVRKYHGNHRIRSLPTYEQFLVLAFAQLTYRESLRDIETCLRALGTKLYHSGIRQPTARSTLADANEKRDWRIFGDFAQVLIQEAKRLYASDPFGVELDQAAYALDSTTVDLCLSLFPWAKFRRHKAAIKLHALLDLRGNFPTVVRLTTGQVHEVNILDELVFEAGSFYIVDRGYLDFARLYRLHLSGAFFVTRARRNFRCQRRYSRPVDKTTGVRFDQTVVPGSFYPRLRYPEGIRRIGFRDLTGKSLVFLTNNFTETALIITQLYHCRWQIELFFKWIKQHLRIKTFYGCSENAVRVQIWTAISVYVLVSIVKKRFGLSASLYTILQILSLSLFEKVPILQVLSQQPPPITIAEINNQPCLPGFLTGQ